MTARNRETFYPSQYYEHWASDFWAVFHALEEDSGRHSVYPEPLKKDTLALVAALFVVTNKIDDLRD